MRTMDKEAGTFIWKALLLFWRLKRVLLVHFTSENFMDLSTWDFDPHLLDQASLSKHVAYESVDRFVTHTWTCQNVSLSVSRAYCHKNIKLLPPPHVCHFSSSLYGWKWEMTRLVGVFNKIAAPGAPGLTCRTAWKCAHPPPDVGTLDLQIIHGMQVLFRSSRVLKGGSWDNHC